MSKWITVYSDDNEYKVNTDHISFVKTNKLEVTIYFNNSNLNFIAKNNEILSKFLSYLEDENDKKVQ